ncbi:MAG TPA: sulfatase-like hydrolase/transferase [Verrucomicrobiae bacterium]|nr:sulfatase-like hydrolase/transferase [Verrucomicrobiae bacterium]
MKFKILPGLKWLTFCALFLSTLVFSGGAEPTAKSGIRKPNLIIILTDDQGYNDVGFHGCNDIPTPNLDSIVRNGVNFADGYVSYSVCSPSRAGLMTGRYEQRFGYERNPKWDPRNITNGLPLTETTLAGALKKVGYHSGIIGKWHLGAHPSLHPLKRGFDEFFGFVGGGHKYFPEEWTITNLFDARNEPQSYRLHILRDYTPVPVNEYLTDAFSDEAVRFVERNKDKPFFLYLAYNAPHEPLEAPQKYLDRFKSVPDKRRRTYDAMVSAVDDGVGHLLEKVRELGLEKNTLIFYLSDNGGFPRANASNNGPLRGTKGTVWEGGWRVPFAAQWPGHLPKGLVYKNPVISLDIFATIAALANAPLDPAHPLDGVNLIPYLTGEKSGAPHNALYLRMFDKGAFAVREGDFELVIPGTNSGTKLFDITRDMGEKMDLSTANPKKLESLEKLRVAWNSQLMAPVFKAETGKTHKSHAKKIVIIVAALVFAGAILSILLSRRKGAKQSKRHTKRRLTVFC